MGWTKRDRDFLREMNISLGSAPERQVATVNDDLRLWMAAAEDAEARAVRHAIRAEDLSVRLKRCYYAIGGLAALALICGYAAYLLWMEATRG